MAIAVFNQTAFLARYSEFANSNLTKLNAIALEVYSGLYLSNSDCSIVSDVNYRTVLLNMLVAHVAAMNGLLTADGQVSPVGRVSDAHEGSVGASFDYGTASQGSGQWYNQTQYGAAFWQATSSLRGMHYRPQPTNINEYTGPGSPYYGGRW